MRRSLLLAGLLVCTSGACSTPSSEAGTASGERSPTVRPELQGDADGVLVLGDSLTNGARLFGDLGDRLDTAGFDDLTIVAEDGADIGWAIDQVDEMATVPDHVVVEIGTNPGAGTDGFADAVDDLIAALRRRGAERIAWLTPAHGRDDRYEPKAAILEAAAGIDVVADWASEVRDDPRRLAADGLHPTQAGYAELARFLVDTASGLAA